MQIHKAHVVDGASLEPGKLSIQNTSVFVGTGQGVLELLRVQLPGGKPVEGNGLLQKLQVYDGAQLE